MRFRSDFAGFLAILCSLPVMAFITVTVYDRATGCGDLASARCPGPVLEEALGDRPTVGRWPLESAIGVRIPVSQPLQALSRSAAGLCVVDPDRFWRLILRESGGRHYAEDGSVLRSSAGAVGAAQVKPATARELGLDAYDVWENLLAGACVLRGHYDASGSWEAALMDYHAGRWRKSTTAATRAYAEDVMGGTQ